MTARASVWGLAALLALLGVCAYWGSLGHAFLWDDFPAIVDNPSIRRLWPLWPVIVPPPEFPVSGRPVTNLSFALTYAFAGLNPWAYHLTSLLIHLGSTCLLFAILRRTLAVATLRRDPSSGLSTAWIVSALWSIHPVHTEALNYATQRSEVLFGFWLLLTVYCALRSYLADRPGLWQAAAALACACGMGSKEVMVGAPVLILLFDRAYFSSSYRQAIQRRAPLYAGLALSWLVFVLQVVSSDYPNVLEFIFSGRRPLWVYAAVQSRAVLHYLRLALWPSPLIIDYGDWPLSEPSAEGLPAVLIVGALLVATLWGVWRRPGFGFLGAWWFILLGPTSSVIFVRSEMIAERRLYLPLVPVLILLVGGIDRWLRCLLQPRPRQRVAALMTASAILACAWLTLRRNADYRTEVSIWMDAVAKRPENSRAHQNLGWAWLRAGFIPEAAASFREAIRLEPRFAAAFSNLGAAYLEQGAFRVGLECIEQALRLDPSLAEAHRNRGKVLAIWGRDGEALAEFDEALRLRAGFAQAHHDRGASLATLGRFEDAVAAYQRAVALEPRYAQAHQDLGLLLMRQGRAEEAQPHLARAAELSSEY
jgi:Flp pilus assembly protein TadD